MIVSPVVSIPTSSYTDIGLLRLNGIWMMTVNGVLVGSSVLDTNTWSFASYFLGAAAGLNQFIGRYGYLRIKRGLTADITTPPTAHFTTPTV